MEQHVSVLLNESISSLEIKPTGTYVDLTLGRGGHSTEILKRLTTGKLIAFDKDIDAIKESGTKLSQISNQYSLIHSDFKNFKNELTKLNILKVDGILADLGISSPQIDSAERGFSYAKDARLDMRMNQQQELDAHIIVNTYSETELVNIFRDYADVMLPQRVAKGIIMNRPIDTTLELVEVIKKSLPAAILRKKNPAKAVFQAIRIAVNDELGALKQIMTDAPWLLNEGASVSIITFHSIEDRIVKKAFGKFVEDNTGKLPIMVEKKWNAFSINPSKEEVSNNKRSRSAKLRVLTKIKD